MGHPQGALSEPRLQSKHGLVLLGHQPLSPWTKKGSEHHGAPLHGWEQSSALLPLPRPASSMRLGLAGASL
jgi:hypothetical protein